MSTRRRLVIVLVAFVLAAIGARDAAAQVTLVAYGPESVAVCEAVEISVAASIPGRTVPRIGLPSFAPFTLLKTSQSARSGADANGRPFTFVEGRYVLTTDQPGTFAIPPFELRTAEGVARSRSLRIRVLPSRGSVPNVVTRARIDTSLDVNFRAIALPETVYVGQQATYEVAVFLGEQVRDRMRRNPTFFPPEMQSMLAYDLPTLRGEPPRRRVGERCFDALVYQRAIFPLLPGRFVIPPAQLAYSLALSASIFSREESREVRTDSVRLVAIEPPLAGRPAGFTGAVGSFAVRARVDTADARVGDPLRLTVRVEGTGNVKLLPRPAVEVPWAALVAADERVQVDSTASLVRGAKEFDWVLTPRIAGELDLPPVRYPYFDPIAERYLVAAAPPLRLRIAPGVLAAMPDSGAREPTLALRARYRGPARPPVHEHPIFWALLAVAPLPAVTRRLREAARALRRGGRPDAVLRSVAGTSATGARELRRAFIDAVADRIGLPAEIFTRAGALARALRRAGVSRATAADAETLLRSLDAAAFGAGPADATEHRQEALELLARIDEEALTRAEMRAGPGASTFVALLALGLAVGAVAAAVPTPRELFAAGHAAYDASRFGESQERFATLANRVPTAPDAWANLGTAAWAAGDTAIAVVGWQRALRLEPLADDVRERLDFAHAADLRSIGFVPPLSVEALALLAGLLWCAAWIADAMRGRRARPSRALRVTLGTLAAAAALVAVDVRERQAGRALAVVGRPTLLAITPALGGERGTAAHRGEIVRVVAREGAWARVRLDAGREGWIESSSLIALVGDAVPVRAGAPAN